MARSRQRRSARPSSARTNPAAPRPSGSRLRRLSLVRDRRPFDLVPSERRPTLIGTGRRAVDVVESVQSREGEHEADHPSKSVQWPWAPFSRELGRVCRASVRRGVSPRFRGSETARAGTEGCPHDPRAGETAEDLPTLSLVCAQADTGDSHFASVMSDRSGRHPDESRADALQIPLDAEALNASCCRAFQYNADEDDGSASTQLGAGERRTCS